MATLTVGNGKTYSTVTAAIAAATAGDTIAIYNKDANGASRLYYETLYSAGKASMTLQGMSPGVGFTYGQGSYFWDVQTYDKLICNDLEFHGFAEIIYCNTYGKHFQVHRCKFYGQRYGLIYFSHAYSWANDNNPAVEIISCYFDNACITDPTKYPIMIYYGTQGGAGDSYVKIYNNTIAGCSNGITVVSGAKNTVDIKNNLSLVSGTCYGGVAASCTFATNGSADATGSVGLQNLVPANMKFASLGGSNYDFKDPRIMSDSPAAGVGTDLSASFTYDIDNQVLAAPFPIGCSKARAYPEPAVGDALANWTDILGATKTAAFDLLAAELAFEAGRNTAANAAYYKTGQTFKQFNATVTGAYSISIPNTPTFTIANDGTGTSCTATISGDAGVTNYIEYKKLTDSDWTAGGNRSGDGTIQVTGLTRGFYQVRCFSKSGDSYSASEVISPIYVDVTAATAYIVQLMEAVKDTINAAALTDSGGDAIAAAIAIPPEFETVGTSCIKIFPDAEETSPTHVQANRALYRVNVAVCERATTEAARNKNMRNVELIKDTFVGKRIALLTTACCTGSSSPNIAEMNALWERFQWISVIQLEFPKLRERL